ncbi:MAG: hypothetical protein R3242_03190 [Akkermansiaceae bacterium]|nr:hypothetical protein [Akkermansiaceae bacterium]
MARRASSGLNPGIILGAVVLLGAVILVGKLILDRETLAFGDTARLPIEDFMQNGNALRENVYVVEGEIDEKLQITSHGQLLSVRVIDSTGSPGDDFVGVQIPSSLANDHNIEMRQKYAFKVKIERGGIAVASAIKRL